MSCLIIKVLENMNFGIKIKSRVSNAQELCTSVAFVDNIDLLEDGPQVQIKMQSMIVEYDDLHSASGGHVENSKTNYFS